MPKRFRLLCLFLCLALAAGIFASCAKKKDDAARREAARQLSRGFSCTVDMTWNGRSYAAKLTKPEGGAGTLAFTKPAELSGLTFSAEGTRLQVKYGVLSASVDAKSIPQSAIYEAVLGAFGAAGGSSAQQNAGGYALSGTTGAGPFTLTLGRDFVPKSLRFPKLGLSLSFSSFAFS